MNANERQQVSVSVSTIHIYSREIIKMQLNLKYIN